MKKVCVAKPRVGPGADFWKRWYEWAQRASGADCEKLTTAFLQNITDAGGSGLIEEFIRGGIEAVVFYSDAIADTQGDVGTAHPSQKQVATFWKAVATIPTAPKDLFQNDDLARLGGGDWGDVEFAVIHFATEHHCNHYGLSAVLSVLREVARPERCCLGN